MPVARVGFDDSDDMLNARNDSGLGCSSVQAGSSRQQSAMTDGHEPFRDHVQHEVSLAAASVLCAPYMLTNSVDLSKLLKT